MEVGHGGVQKAFDTVCLQRQHKVLVTGVPDEVVRLADERLEARNKQDFATADAIRERIRDLGWSVEDAKGGAKFRKL